MSRIRKICLKCDAQQQDAAALNCGVCAGPLGFRYSYDDVTWDDRFAGTMWRYWPMLPVDGPDGAVTLDEGGTPLLPARNFEGQRVYLKDETRNPTGSHKDRSLSVAITHAKAVGADVSVIVSTGSAGISNAALAARAGMRSAVVMTEGTPPERLYPMYGLGAVLLEVKAQIDPIVEGVISVCREQGLYLSTTSRNSNPYQCEGNKTIAYEIVEELGRAPDWVVVPVGGGGTVSGVWRGFWDCHALGLIDFLPRMIGVVPRDYNALELAFERGLEQWKEVLALPYDNPPPSILVKLAHSYPPDGMEALRTIRASRGNFISVTDEEALTAQEFCGRQEGLFVEPSTGACLAGTARLLDSGRVDPGDLVVAVVSGSGYRETACTMASRPLKKQAISIEELSGTLAGFAGPG